MEVAFQQLSNTAQLKSTLERLQLALSRNGINAAAAADISIQRFADLSASEQNKILISLAIHTRIMQLDPEIAPAPAKPLNRPEVVRTQRALKEFGLRTLNDSVFNTIEEGDIVEIYSGQGTQLYRNVTFCKTCSYNLLDLAVNSWDELYEKPTTAMEAIGEIIQNILTEGVETRAYNLGSFIQKEKFMYASALRTFLLTPKYISPLFEEFTGRRAGFLSTCTAEVIAEGNESTKFDIL